MKTVQFFNNNKSDVVVVRALTKKNETMTGKSIESLAHAAGRIPDDTTWT